MKMMSTTTPPTMATHALKRGAQRECVPDVQGVGGNRGSELSRVSVTIDIIAFVEPETKRECVWSARSDGRPGGAFGKRCAHIVSRGAARGSRGNGGGKLWCELRFSERTGLPTRAATSSPPEQLRRPRAPDLSRTRPPSHRHHIYTSGRERTQRPVAFVVLLLAERAVDKPI
jgi:hypothetical protein